MNKKRAFVLWLALVSLRLYALTDKEKEDAIEERCEKKREKTLVDTLNTINGAEDCAGSVRRAFPACSDSATQPVKTLEGTNGAVKTTKKGNFGDLGAKADELKKQNAATQPINRKCVSEFTTARKACTQMTQPTPTPAFTAAKTDSLSYINSVISKCDAAVREVDDLNKKLSQTDQAAKDLTGGDGGSPSSGGGDSGSGGGSPAGGSPMGSALAATPPAATPPKSSDSASSGGTSSAGVAATTSPTSATGPSTDTSASPSSAGNNTASVLPQSIAGAAPPTTENFPGVFPASSQTPGPNPTAPNADQATNASAPAVAAGGGGGAAPSGGGSGGTGSPPSDSSGSGGGGSRGSRVAAEDGLSRASGGSVSGSGGGGGGGGGGLAGGGAGTIDSSGSTLPGAGPKLPSDLAPITSTKKIPERPTMLASSFRSPNSSITVSIPSAQPTPPKRVVAANAHADTINADLRGSTPSSRSGKLLGLMAVVLLASGCAAKSIYS